MSWLSVSNLQTWTYQRITKHANKKCLYIIYNYLHIIYKHFSYTLLFYILYTSLYFIHVLGQSYSPSRRVVTNPSTSNVYSDFSHLPWACSHRMTLCSECLQIPMIDADFNSHWILRGAVTMTPSKWWTFSTYQIRLSNWHLMHTYHTFRYNIGSVAASKITSLHSSILRVQFTVQGCTRALSPFHPFCRVHCMPKLLRNWPWLTLILFMIHGIPTYHHLPWYYGSKTFKDFDNTTYSYKNVIMSGQQIPFFPVCQYEYPAKNCPMQNSPTSPFSILSIGMSWTFFCR